MEELQDKRWLRRTPTKDLLAFQRAQHNPDVKRELNRREKKRKK